MQKTNIARFENLTLRLQQVMAGNLRELWNDIVLTGQFWRLYYNNEPGAWIEAGTHRIDLEPDQLYLVPPNSGARAHLEYGAPLQVFVHFELTGIGGSSDYPCTMIPATECQEQMAELRRLLTGLVDGADDVRRYMLAYCLVGYALSRMPKEGLCAMSYDARIAAACRCLRHNFAAEVVLSDLASRYGMAPNAFLRRFREVTGTTPHQYLLNQRYAAAAQLLECPEHSIKDICESVGVPDRFHFSRTFKKLYGLPPAQYRQTLWRNS